MSVQSKILPRKMEGNMIYCMLIMQKIPGPVRSIYRRFSTNRTPLDPMPKHKRGKKRLSQIALL